MARTPPRPVRRRTLQQALFLVWLLAFGISISVAMVRFVDVVWDYQQFVLDNEIGRCRTDDGFDPGKQRLCQNYGNEHDIDVFDASWQGNLLANYFENIAKIFLPILAVMLTTFLSSSRKFKDQFIRRDQFWIAFLTFTVVHLLTLMVVGAFLLFSVGSSVNEIPNLLATAFSVIMGIVVGFSFPETTDEAAAKEPPAPVPAAGQRAG